jgi:hypothetical protein
MRVLEHGDVIAIGDSYFRFIVPGQQEVRSEATETGVAFEDPPLSGCTTVSLQREGRFPEEGPE